MDVFRIIVFFICKILLSNSLEGDYKGAHLHDNDSHMDAIPKDYLTDKKLIRHWIVKRDLDGPGLYYYKYLKEREKMKNPYTPKHRYKYNKRHPFRGSTKKLRSSKNSQQDSWIYFTEPANTLRHPTGSPELYAIFPHLTPKRFKLK